MGLTFPDRLEEFDAKIGKEVSTNPNQPHSQ